VANEPLTRHELRADLAEFKLDIERVIYRGLAEKVAVSELGSVKNEVAKTNGRIQAWESGSFSDAQRRAVHEIIHTYITSRTATNWTTTQKWMAAALFVVTVTAFVLTLID